MVLGLDTDPTNMIVSMVFFFALIFLYPKLMFMQVMVSLERTVKVLEDFNNKGRSIAVHKATRSPSKSVRESVSSFLDFFVISPVDIDPAGALRRLEHMGNLGDRRFRYFVKSVAPHLSKEEQANMAMTLAGAISLNQIMKVVRHFVEVAKKTRNPQIAMIIQMQLPMVERIAKAMLRGTESFSNGWPVGDSIGPLVASHFIGDSRTKDIIDDETIFVKKKIAGRNVYVVRAKGPGGRLGSLGRSVEALAKRGRIAKIITVDAAAKLEGEKTGSVAEGIGVAIGGIGVDRGYIERLATDKDIPLDTVIVKMSQEEAIMPMRSEILAATPRVLKLVENNIRLTKGGDIILIGVGNCTGIGNTKKEAVKAEDVIKKVDAQIKKEEREEERKQKSFRGRFLGM